MKKEIKWVKSKSEVSEIANELGINNIKYRKAKTAHNRNKKLATSKFVE